MIPRLTDALDFHGHALALRAQRQQVIAANIANADTPGYQARDFDFASALRAARGAGGPGDAIVDMDRERANFMDNALKFDATLRFINGNVRTTLDAMKSPNSP